MRSFAPPSLSSRVREHRREARRVVAGKATLGATSLGAVALGLLLSGLVAGGTGARAERPALPLASRDLLPKDQLFPVPFGPGETLVYTLAWLKVEGGEMTLSTSREASADGVPVHRITLTATSNDYVDKFFRVRDRYESWVDARDFQPLRFEKHAREGHYESDEVEEFDLARRVGAWRDEKTPLPERFQDIISSFYYLRSVPLVPGKDVLLEMYSRGKLYKLKVLVLGRERVDTEAGAFDAVKVQPEMREGGSAEDRNRGKLFLWFTEDSRRLPVMARTVMPIGSVTARLRKVSGSAPPREPSALPAR